MTAPDDASPVTDEAERRRREAATALGQAQVLGASHPELERLLRLSSSSALLGVLEVLRRMEDRLATSAEREELARLRAENAELRRQLEAQRAHGERLRQALAWRDRGRPWP